MKSIPLLHQPVIDTCRKATFTHTNLRGKTNVTEKKRNIITNNALMILRYTGLGLLTVMLSFSSYAQKYSHIFRLPERVLYTELKFQIEQNLVIIPLTINGSKNLNFVLDTGTQSPVILNKKYIKKLSLPLGRDISFQGLGTKCMTKGQVINSMQIQIGEAHAGHIGGVVLNNNALGNLRINGIPIHGVIGSSLFRSFAVEIDYPNQIIRFFKDSSVIPEQQYIPHEMLISKSSPVLKSVIKHHGQEYNVDLMIDTGMGYEMLLYDSKLFEQAGLNTKIIGKGYCGRIKAASTRLDSLEMGKLTFENVLTVLPTAASYQAKYADIKNRDGTIGNKLLMKYCVVLDYANNRFYIKSDQESLPLAEVLRNEAK